MSGRAVNALLRKEMLDLSRNLGVLVPVGVTACLALILPFALATLVPTLAGHQLGDDSDLVRISSRFWSVQGLSAEGRVQLFFFDQSVLLFLLLPTTGAMTLAAHSVVSEKQARTLEPLLATPVTTVELLLAKMLGAFLPAFAISLASVLVYLAGVGWVAEPGSRVRTDGLPACLDRRKSASRGKLFFRLAQQAVAAEPHPLEKLRQTTTD